MQRHTRFQSLACMLAGLALTACGNSQFPADTVSSTAPPASKFDIGKGCFTLLADNDHVVRDGSAYVTRAAQPGNAERFYMQPAGLGRYLFYTADGLLMTANGSAVSAAATPADGSDWTLVGDNGRFTASTLGQSLGTDNSGNLALGSQAAALIFEPAAGCVAYPEMPVGIAANTYKGPSVGQPVIGFAEVHAHMAMGSDMSDGSGDRGPSAGGVMYGHAVNRFGVTAALENCEVMHGPEGTASAENVILDQDPTQTHDTVGWPSFVDWPKSDSMLHQQMYYRWVERAYKAGLRTMTVHGTSIEALCNIARDSAGDSEADCVDMGVGTKQVEYLYDIQDYVDAQQGGPGQGWFRIVKDPAEARTVIADGKLAVIPGLEFSNIFHCRLTYNPDGSENSDCTKEDIDREIDEAWDLGVRQVFPYHDVDSSLGGTGIFSSTLNYVGYYDTKGFWDMYPCDDGGEGPLFFFNAGAVMESSGLTQFNDPISQAFVDNNAGTVPVYGPGRQCNARTVTELGRYAIDKIMKKGFILDIDHAEIRSKQYMLDEAAKLTPNYPMVSGHGGHGGISNLQAEQMIRQGGIIYPALPNGKDWVAFLEKVKPIWDNSGTTRPLSVGYGADANGLRTLPSARGAGTEAIEYPFTLFQGPGWGPQFAAAGIAPMEVEMLSIPGGKSWNMDEEGMSNYGLVADIVEEIRIEGGSEAIDAFYNSAETYLQMWEQTLQSSADARSFPTP